MRRLPCPGRSSSQSLGRPECRPRYLASGGSCGYFRNQVGGPALEDRPSQDRAPGRDLTHRKAVAALAPGLAGDNPRLFTCTLVRPLPQRVIRSGTRRAGFPRRVTSLTRLDGTASTSSLSQAMPMWITCVWRRGRRAPDRARGPACRCRPPAELARRPARLQEARRAASLLRRNVGLHGLDGQPLHRGEKAAQRGCLHSRRRARFPAGFMRPPHTLASSNSCFPRCRCCSAASRQA